MIVAIYLIISYSLCSVKENEHKIGIDEQWVYKYQGTCKKWNFFSFPLLLEIKWVASKICNCSQEQVLSILDLQMNSNKHHIMADKLILKGT